MSLPLQKFRIAGCTAAQHRRILSNLQTVRPAVTSIRQSTLLFSIHQHHNPSLYIRQFRLLSTLANDPTVELISTATPIVAQNGQQQQQQQSNNRRWLSIILGGSCAFALSVGAKYSYDHIGDGSFEGLQRSLSFYSLAVPKYIQYRYHVYRKSPDEVWDELDRRTSQQGLEKILQLKGFYIKCGQMCAANIGNAFPPIWQDTMSILQDQCPAEDYTVIHDIIESEFRSTIGKSFDQVFSSFEKTPVGAASIGQVHRATLNDGKNTPVVVKVCYPNVERLLRGDVRTITAFARIAQPVHVPGLLELEKQLQNEFDYVQEAKQLDRVRINLTEAGLAGPDKLCRVPKPYLEYCTKRVLVMEELVGDKLVNELRKDLERYTQYNTGQTTIKRAGTRNLTLTQDGNPKIQEQGQQDKEKQGPTASQYDTYISLLDAKRKAHNAKVNLYNWTIGLLSLGKLKDDSYQDYSVLPLNHAKLVDDIIYIHGHEVLVDGCFNGDPHPGNIMLLRDKKDGKPQLGLIDYGQVKQLSKESRHLFARIILALCEDDRDKIVALMKEAGYKSKYMDPDVIYIYAKVSYDMDNMELTGGKHVQIFMEELQSRDPISQIPTEFIMVGRASIFIRGLCHALHQSRSIAQAWKPIAEKVLREDI